MAGRHGRQSRRPAPHRSSSATQGGPDLAAPPRPGAGRRCATRVAGVATAGRTARTEHKRGQFRADSGRPLGRHLTCRGGRHTAAARGCGRQAATGRSCRSGTVVADLPSTQSGRICPNQRSRRPDGSLGIQACRAHRHRPCAAHPDQPLVARLSYGSRSRTATRLAARRPHLHNQQRAQPNRYRPVPGAAVAHLSSTRSCPRRRQRSAASEFGVR
jgi:hypothetical protein